MALEYFLYNENYNNTLVDRSMTSFAPTPLGFGQILIDFLIPETQPLYLYREQSDLIVLNDEATINDYLEGTAPPSKPEDSVETQTFTGYTAQTATQFNVYSANTYNDINTRVYRSGDTMTGTLNTTGNLLANGAVTGSSLSASVLMTTPILNASTSISAPQITGSTCITSPISCATTRLQAPVVCGGTCVISPITIGSTCVTSPRIIGSISAVAPIVSGSTCVTSPITCATTRVQSPIVCGGTCSQSPLICGTTRVQSPIVCGSTCSTSPITCATTRMQAPIVCATSCVRAPLVSGTTLSSINFTAACVCGTTCVKSPSISGGTVLGSTCVSAPITCATTRMQAPIVCATTIVQAPAICGNSYVNSPIISGVTSYAGICLCSLGTTRLVGAATAASTLNVSGVTIFNTGICWLNPTTGGTLNDYGVKWDPITKRLRTIPTTGSTANVYCYADCRVTATNATETNATFLSRTWSFPAGYYEYEYNAVFGNSSLNRCAVVCFLMDGVVVGYCNLMKTNDGAVVTTAYITQNNTLSAGNHTPSIVFREIGGGTASVYYGVMRIQKIAETG